MADSADRTRFGPALALGDELVHIGRALHDRGMTEHAVQACFGVNCVGHVPRCTTSTPAPATLTRAAVLPWLLVAGKTLPAEAVRAVLGDELHQTMCRAALLAERDAHVRALVCMLPVGEALAVCNRIGGDDVPLPDDSSFHMIGALPARRVDRWLDIGTGTAIAPLARRGLGGHVVGADVNTAVLACARLGAELSGATELELRTSDLFAAVEPDTWPLITFNAPLPQPGSELLARFWHDVRARVDDHSEVLVHSQQPRDSYIESLQLPGDVLVARYTPEAMDPAFGVTRWRPGGRHRSHLRHVSLTPAHPHVTRADLEW